MWRTYKPDRYRLRICYKELVNVKPHLGIVSSLIISAILYCVIFLWGTAEATTNPVWQLSVTNWAAILLLSVVNYALRYLRWERCIFELTALHIPHFDHALSYVAGFAFTMTPGKAGEALRGVFLKKYGVDYRASLASFLFERILDLITILLMAALAILAFPRYGWLLLIAVALLAVVLFALHGGLCVRICQRLTQHRKPGIARLAGKLTETLEDATRLLAWRPLGAGLLLGLLAWGAEGWGLYYILHALHAPVTLPLALGIYALAMLAGALSFIPGGLGGAEAVMTLCLTAAGCPLPVAIAATLICRIATLWFATLLGLLACTLVALRRPGLVAPTPHGE